MGVDEDDRQLARRVEGPIPGVACGELAAAEGAAVCLGLRRFCYLG